MTRLSELDLDNLQRNQSLAKFTAARLGGKADWLYVTSQEDRLKQLASILMTAWDDGLPVRIIGSGANILVSDKGYRGLVVVNRTTKISFDNWHEGRTVAATAGTGLLRLARDCASRGIAGMEWAVGVPGTVGGAIVNNAGAHGADMSDSIADVVVLEAERGPQLYTREDLAYGYRYSTLKAREDKRFAVLLATLQLPYGRPDQIKERMTEYNDYRKQTQPSGASLGSIFKNPPDDFAGRVIEAAGLKGYTIGGAQVSPIHANFFVNTGEATATDYYALIQHVREEVFKHHQIELELEIELLGKW